MCRYARTAVRIRYISYRMREKRIQQAQNALLKTIEEPPEYVVIFTPHYEFSSISPDYFIQMRDAEYEAGIG